ncbi:hypothetical protein ACHAQH_006597 [Verticillium albo-atrum]
MDAHALLTSQGWRGAGHSLHATSDAIGLSKPLLLNRRDGNKGIGQKAHYTSDQWWMNAFDEQLQGLSTTTSKDGTLGVVQAVKNGGRIGGVEKGAGGRWRLGGCFVKGGFLEGTIEQMKREKQEEEDETTSDDSATGTSTPIVNGDVKETKAERKARRATRRAEREIKRQKKEAKRSLKASKKSSKSSSKRSSSDEDSEKPVRDETREERRARREAKRIRREARKTG